jgi:capsular exopolysaccharide synthesis family protein
MSNPEQPDLYPSQRSSSGETTSEFHTLVRLILDRVWMIAAITAVFLILAAVYVQRAPRIYRATSTVQVEQEEQKVLDTPNVMDSDLRSLDMLNTIVQKLRSRALIERVLEYQDMLPPEDQMITNADGKVVNREDVISGYVTKITTTLRRNTRLIDVTVDVTDPKLAAQLANSIVEEFLGLDTAVNSSSSKGAYAFLQAQADQLKSKLEASERALQDYRQQVGAVTMDDSQNNNDPELKDIQGRLEVAQEETIRAKAAFEDISKLGTNLTELLAHPEIANDPSVMAVRASLTDQENQMAMIQQRYKEKHPKYIMASNNLAAVNNLFYTTVLDAKSRAQEAFRVPYQSAKIAQDALQSALQNSESNALQMSQNAIRYNLLERQVESDRAIYSSVITRLNETSVTSDLASGKIHIIQRAYPPDAPFSPNVKNIFGLAILAAIGLSLAIIFMLHALDTTLTSVEQAEDYLQLPVLSTVPKIRNIDGTEGHLVASEGANSIGAEVFRTLRTSLSMLGKEGTRRTYLFTSSLPSEGKTFTSINYAGSLAQQGFRTLLIDADLRRPGVEKFLVGERSKSLGTTDVLLGRKKLEEVIQKHPSVEKLFWMSAGTVAPNPAELLADNGFPQLIEEALSQFDRVVVDTAPIHPVSDTLVIAKYIQTVILVIHGGRTPRKPVSRTVELLTKAGAKPVGIVLNLLLHRRSGGYYYYSNYYGYGYGHYGREEDKKGKKSKKAE